MIKKKNTVIRNNSHRYSTHAESARNELKSLMNLPNLNTNSAFGNHGQPESSDEENDGRSFH